MNMAALRERCQGPRQTKDTWYGRNVMRRFSIYITLLFVKIGIRATPASLIFLASGLVSAVLFAGGTRGYFFAAAMMLQVFYLLDHVDGEVARYNDETSLTGKYLDELIHYIVHPLIFLGAGWGLFRLSGGVNLAYILLGISGGFGVILLNLIIDLKNLILLRNFHRHGTGDGFAYAAGAGSNATVGATTGKRIFAKIDLICHFVSIMNVITAAAVVDLFFGTMVMAWVVSFYAVFLNLIWIAKAVVFVGGRRVDSGWESGQFK